MSKTRAAQALLAFARERHEYSFDDEQIAASRTRCAGILQTIEQLQTFPGLSRRGRAGGTCERVVSGTPYIICL